MLARTAALLLLAIPLQACTSIKPGSRTAFSPEGKIITSVEIERIGALDAWEVLKRSGTHLSLNERRNGEPARMARRGQSSIVLSDIPLVYVDGVQMVDFRYLRQIPANVIASMRILNGIQATRYYGTNAGSGVIVIETKTGPSED